MKKDVLIRIKGVQITGEEKDVTELFTQGLFYKKNSCYYISYDESETTGFVGCKTTLKVDGNEKVILMRTGNARSHLIMENGERNVGYYGTSFGEMMVGVYTKEISTELTDGGGDIYFCYELDINSTLISENEVFINVSEEQAAGI